MLKYTVLIILLFFFLFFFLVFQNSFNTKHKEIDMLSRCKQSTMVSQLKQPEAFKQIIQQEIPKEKSGLELDCPIIYKTINILGDDDFYAKKIIADQMAGAVYKFNAGKANLFSRVKGETVNYCVVSSVISFEGVAKNKKITGLEKFMAEKKTPILFSTNTYAKYLMPTATDDELLKYTQELVAVQDLIEIDTSNDYIVLYVYPKEGFTSQLEATVTGATIGGGTGFLINTIANFIPQARAVKWLLGTKFVIGTSALGGWIGSFFGEGKGYETGSSVLLLPYHEELLKGLGCELPVPLGVRPS